MHSFLLLTHTQIHKQSKQIQWSNLDVPFSRNAGVWSVLFGNNQVAFEGGKSRHQKQKMTLGIESPTLPSPPFKGTLFGDSQKSSLFAASRPNFAQPFKFELTREMHDVLRLHCAIPEAADACAFESDLLCNSFCFASQEKGAVLRWVRHGVALVWMPFEAFLRAILADALPPSDAHKRTFFMVHDKRGALKRLQDAKKRAFSAAVRSGGGVIGTAAAASSSEGAAASIDEEMLSAYETKLAAACIDARLRVFFSEETPLRSVVSAINAHCDAGQPDGDDASREAIRKTLGFCAQTRSRGKCAHAGAALFARWLQEICGVSEAAAAAVAAHFASFAAFMEEAAAAAPGSEGAQFEATLARIVVAPGTERERRLGPKLAARIAKVFGAANGSEKLFGADATS